MIPYLRFLSGEERSRDSNRHLGLTLAFVAGAVNAGGYVAVSRYTSHMTGIVASISNQLALGEYRLAAGGLAAYVSFLGGAATSAILINWARRRKRHSRYALPLMIEAFLLLAFGLLGANRPLPAGLLVPATVLLLCYTMGLQNAVITKISGAEIRTTHVTGLTTDLGIELGKLLFWNGEPREAQAPSLAAGALPLRRRPRHPRLQARRVRLDAPAGRPALPDRDGPRLGRRLRRSRGPRLILNW
jgi:uncharacterized membrane protein YoaK (UPF0700 family)